MFILVTRRQNATKNKRHKLEYSMSQKGDNYYYYVPDRAIDTLVM